MAKFEVIEESNSLDLVKALEKWRDDHPKADRVIFHYGMAADTDGYTYSVLIIYSEAD